jgi:diacylglycerol kinase (ATP)
MALKLLMNARAGRLHRTPSVEEMRATLKVLGLDIEVIGSGSKADFRQLVRGLVREGVERIAIAGGDGTVRLAAVEAANSSTALAIVPQGTMNNFATALRLPMDLPGALRTACEGEIRRIDLGRACGELFTESAGVGLFANALSIYGRHNKNPWFGLKAIARTLLDFRPSRVTLDVDGERWEERAAWVVAANGFRMAQALPVAPGASLTDGRLDLVVLGDLRRSELIPYYLAIRRQTHLTLPKTRICTARHIGLSSRRPMLVHVDDRIAGRTPAQIEVVPAGLRMVVERL